MIRNPLFNAAAAFGYIVAVALLIIYGLAGVKEEGVIMPVTMLSLLVLSVLVMGYTLLLEPLMLCFDGKPREGSSLFVRTLAVFACATAVSITACITFFS